MDFVIWNITPTFRLFESDYGSSIERTDKGACIICCINQGIFDVKEWYKLEYLFINRLNWTTCMCIVWISNYIRITLFDSITHALISMAV